MPWRKRRDFMAKVTDIAPLVALYGAPGSASVIKVLHHVTPLFAKWICASRLSVLSPVGLDGTDASPRGGDGEVVQIADPKTLLMPDWRGNNRMDNLRCKNHVVNWLRSAFKQPTLLIPVQDIYCGAQDGFRLWTCRPFRPVMY